jgi:uracil-DNA glycosylase
MSCARTPSSPISSCTPCADAALGRLLAEIAACRVCAAHLPDGPRPVLQAGGSARVLLVGQAPSAAVHASGIPFDDASGRRLRRWLGVAPAIFYDPDAVAILPLGLCWPGRGRRGDHPPRHECAPLWQDRVRALLGEVELVLALGRHAVARELGGSTTPLMSRVAAGDPARDGVLALPHPSPRNQAVLARHPWFEGRFLPRLRARLASLSLGR